jgi:hypothetical protein
MNPKINQENYTLAKSLLGEGIKGMLVAKVLKVDPVTIYRINKSSDLNDYFNKNREDFARRHLPKTVTKSQTNEVLDKDKIVSLLNSILRILKDISDQINDGIINKDN